MSDLEKRVSALEGTCQSLAAMVSSLQEQVLYLRSQQPQQALAPPHRAQCNKHDSNPHPADVNLLSFPSGLPKSSPTISRDGEGQAVPDLGRQQPDDEADLSDEDLSSDEYSSPRAAAGFMSDLVVQVTPPSIPCGDQPFVSSKSNPFLSTSPTSLQVPRGPAPLPPTSSMLLVVQQRTALHYQCGNMAMLLRY
jgi:hypothetical protein